MMAPAALRNRFPAETGNHEKPFIAGVCVFCGDTTHHHMLTEGRAHSEPCCLTCWRFYHDKSKPVRAWWR